MVAWEGAEKCIESSVGYLSENPNPKETSVSTFVFKLRPEGFGRANCTPEFRIAGAPRGSTTD